MMFSRTGHSPFINYPVDPPSLALGALEIRVHVGRDFRAVRPRSVPPHGSCRSLPNPARRAISASFTWAVASRMREPTPCLSSGPLRRFVEHRAGPPAAQQAQRTEAVGDQGDHARSSCRPAFSSTPFRRSRPRRSRSAVAAARRGHRRNRPPPARAKTGRDYRAKPRSAPGGASLETVPARSSWHGVDPQKNRIMKPNDEN